MAISLGSNLALHAKLPLDDRTLFELISDMKAYPENFLADMCYAMNKEDGNLYIFNRTNTVDAITGKWRLLKSNPDIATTTDLGVVYVPATGGIIVEPDGAIHIDGTTVPMNTSTPNPDGTTTTTTTIGGIPITTVTGSDGTPISSTIGGTVVVGSTTTTTTGTDSNGNPTSTTTTITATPTGPVSTSVTTGGGTAPDGSTYTTTTTTTSGGGNPPSSTSTTSTTPAGGGNTTTVTTTTGGGGLGGVTQTTTEETDPSGNPVGDPTTDTDILDDDGDSMLLTKEEVDDMFDMFDW